MEKIIAQAAAPGGVERQARPGADKSRAEDFSIEMDKAVKGSSDKDARTEDAGTRSAGSEEVEMADNKKTDTEQSAAAGLMSASPVGSETIAAVKGDEDTLKAVVGIDVAAAAPVDSAEVEGEAAVEGKAMNILKENASERKYLDTEKLPEAKVSTEEVNDAADAMDEFSSSVEKKSALHSKGESIAHTGVGSASGTDEATEMPDAKTASTAAVNAGSADDMDGSGLANSGRENKGGFNHSANSAGETVGVTPLQRQEAAYEAVASRTELSGGEKSEVYEKLSTGVRMSIARDGGEVKLSLRPDHLGNLNIKLNIEEGNVSARIIVESAAVKEALDADSGTLREVFTKNNLVLDKYTVEVADKGFSFESSTSGFSGFEKSSSQGFFNGNDMVAVATDELITAAGHTPGPKASGIDLFI